MMNDDDKSLKIFCLISAWRLPLEKRPRSHVESYTFRHRKILYQISQFSKKPEPQKACRYKHIQASENSSQNVSVQKKKARAKGGMQVQSLICCFKGGLLQKVSKRIQIWKRLFYWLSCCALFCIFEEFRGASQFQCWQYNDFLQVYHIKGQQETHTVQLYHHGSMLGNMVYQWFLPKKSLKDLLCVFTEPHLPRRLKPHKYALSTLSPMSTPRRQIRSSISWVEIYFVRMEPQGVFHSKPCRATTIRKKLSDSDWAHLPCIVASVTVRKEKLCLDMEVENICENISEQRPKIFLNTELLVDIWGEDMVRPLSREAAIRWSDHTMSICWHLTRSDQTRSNLMRSDSTRSDQMRHSDSLPSADLLQRLWGIGLAFGGLVAEYDEEEGGVSVGEFPSEQSEALGLSTEFIRGPFRPCLFASKLIWQ